MTSARPARRFQFTLRRLLAMLTWGALLFAICVGQQQAAVRQRVHLEHLKAMGLLPRWSPNRARSPAGAVAPAQHPGQVTRPLGSATP